MRKWKVCSLDVWGNETTGYDVNDAFTIGFCNEGDQADGEDLVESVIGEYLKGTIDNYSVSDNGDSFIEISLKSTGEPVLHLLLEREHA